MNDQIEIPPCPLGPESIGDNEARLRTAQENDPASFLRLREVAQELGLGPATFALLLETVELRDREGPDVTPELVWRETAGKLEEVMCRAVRIGTAGGNRLQVLDGNWASRLARRGSALGAGWDAFIWAIAVQEFNAGMGLVSAAPTGGASGTVPGALLAVSEALDAEPSARIKSLLVAGLVGRVAFGRGPVSGAQAGCGGEVGIAAAMAAGASAYLLGGGWVEIDAAAALAASPFIGLECSPSFGLVEFPCVPRNGFAAICAIAAAEAACAGIVPPHDLDETFDRIFGVGALLPESLREREDGIWMASACHCRCKSGRTARIHTEPLKE